MAKTTAKTMAKTTAETTAEPMVRLAIIVGSAEVELALIANVNGFAIVKNSVQRFDSLIALPYSQINAENGGWMALASG